MDWFKMETKLLAALVCVLYMAKGAGPCPPENIPVFEDTSPRTKLPGPVYAIVPAYTFTCHGNITLWGACVQPGGFSGDRYDIAFVVFRPSPVGVVGCYDEVGSNFLDDGAPGVTGGNIDHCVVLTDIPPEDQIQVQPGDVVGFFAFHYRDGQQRDGGIQLDLDIDTVVVWSTEILTISNSDICPFRIGVDGNLASSSVGAPVITAQVVTATPAMAIPTSSSTSRTSSSLSTPSTSTSSLLIPSPPGPPQLDTPSTQSHTTIQPSRSTLSQSQPPVPSSTKPSVAESSNNEFTSQNLIFYGATGGVIGLVLIVATVCAIVVIRKKRGVANISLQDNIQTKGNEAYSTHLTSLPIPTAQNEAYSAVQLVDGNQLIYEEPSAVETNIPVIPTAQNDAYGAVGSGGEDIEYDYVTR